MFDLLDTLTGTVKPDYRSPAAIAYRQSKPAAYYDRQCKVRKIKPNEYPAKPLGPKELPSVEELIAGAKITAYGQIHSCGWYLGDSGVTRYGEAHFGSNGAKTLEDCVAKFHAAVVEKRASFAQRVELEKEVAAYTKPKVAKLATGKSYAMPEDVEGKHNGEVRHCLAKVGEAYVGCNTYSLPMAAEKVLAWDTHNNWIPTSLNGESLRENYAYADPIELPVVKGATHYGAFNGRLGAWMIDKEGGCTKLFDGQECGLGYDWVCKADVLFAFNNGRDPKQATFIVKPSGRNNTGAGWIVGPDWVVLPVDLEKRGLKLV